ncbi:DUF6412 domain-containing protein [Amycolatopsis rhizosphaerae]|uniref:DUF6412 domain-containing protein n=1 Tax=Amycolatopsis rhizosphaerae TaxID=2053003 RepID=UPI001FEC4301|nr:DUF6412 domain-containing protein [Amycolatopsis rhizosphaerae]
MPGEMPEFTEPGHVLRGNDPPCEAPLVARIQRQGRRISRRVVAVERSNLGVGMRFLLALALFLPTLFVALPLVGGLNPLGLATALTVSLAVAVLAITVHIRVEPTAAVMRVRTISLRERAQLFLRLRDPDAPGRTRSRAPSAGSAAA